MHVVVVVVILPRALSGLGLRLPTKGSTYSYPKRCSSDESVVTLVKAGIMRVGLGWLACFAPSRELSLPYVYGKVLNEPSYLSSQSSPRSLSDIFHQRHHTTSTQSFPSLADPFASYSTAFSRCSWDLESTGKTLASILSEASRSICTPRSTWCVDATHKVVV